MDFHGAASGWFADLADEGDASPEAPWQPFLQVIGCCLPLQIGFRTEAECLKFIRDEIVGKGVLAPEGGGRPITEMRVVPPPALPPGG